MNVDWRRSLTGIIEDQSFLPYRSSIIDVNNNMKIFNECRSLTGMGELNIYDMYSVNKKSL